MSAEQTKTEHATRQAVARVATAIEDYSVSHGPALDLPTCVKFAAVAIRALLGESDPAQETPPATPKGAP